MKRSARYKDILQLAAHALRSNREIISIMIREFQCRQKQFSKIRIPAADFERFRGSVDETIRELSFAINHVQLISQRLDQATETVSAVNQFAGLVG